MTDLELLPAALLAMRAHARESYPQESCGFLVSVDGSGLVHPRRVVDVERGRNVSQEDRHRRFEIRAEELREVEERLARTGKFVSGFYHSHPDGDPTPSIHDVVGAWPWYSYLILGVTAGSSETVAAFELNTAAGRLEPHRVIIPPGESKLDPERDSMNLLAESGER